MSHVSQSRPVVSSPSDGSVRLEIAAATDPGRVRPGNEDAFVVGSFGHAERGNEPLDLDLCADTHGAVLAVCDGMGGHVGGEVASGEAALAIRRAALRASRPSGAEALGRVLVEAVRDASRAV